MRVVGLDVGSRTIGVAVSDELGIAAHPLRTLRRSAGPGAEADRRDAGAIAQVVDEVEAGQVVVGLPLELDGAVGPRARRVKAFAACLRAALGPGRPVELWDERFSTAAVERTLLEADLSRARRKQVVDRAAAAYILQGWLDARGPRLEGGG